MPVALLDTNVLVHAASKRSPLVVPATKLLREGVQHRNRFCIAPQNLLEFVTAVTRARYMDPPLSSAEAARRAQDLYRSRRLKKIYPSRGTVFRALQEGAALGVSGPLWFDLFLALTMRDAGVRLIVTENTADFRTFPFLTTRGIREFVES